MIRILLKGKLPRHMAFIMDGNRRYATRTHLADRRLGHVHGYHSLERLLSWCHRLSIPCITVYTFSVENFKRSSEEVETLMDLAESKLTELAKRADEVEASVRVVGEVHLLPERVLEAASMAVNQTFDNRKGIVNVCLPYTSKLEIQRAEREFVEMASCPQFVLFDQQDLFKTCLDSFDSPPIDILVRTSGEKRLSEFQTYQLATSPNCQYEFLNVMWPDLNFWHLLKILLRFQSNRTGDASSDLPLELLKYKRKKYLRRFTANELAGR